MIVSNMNNALVSRLTPTKKQVILYQSCHMRKSHTMQAILLLQDLTICKLPHCSLITLIHYLSRGGDGRSRDIAYSYWTTTPLKMPMRNVLCMPLRRLVPRSKGMV